MIAALRRAYARFRGFDIDGSAVPAMDGPLSPNTRLDDAPVLGHFAALDNLTVTDHRLLASQGHDLVSLTRGSAGWVAQRLRSLEAPIASLAAGPEGAIAIGLDGHGVALSGGRHDGRMITSLGGAPLRCPTAMAFADADTLIVAQGSSAFDAADWKRDLMTLGAGGSLWQVSLATGEGELLARDLAFPSGIVLGSGGEVFVSEAWRHRILSIGPGGQRRVLLDQLPAYPGRILAARNGGFWLALFAPRNQLIEFVLREHGYRRRMIAEIEPDLWVAPALSSGTSFLEPIQGGARKKLNMLKPWSPSWSYGLVVRCNDRMQPVASYHSRADGQVHGVTSLAEQNGFLLVGARGSGMLVGLNQVEARVGRAA